MLDQVKTMSKLHTLLVLAIGLGLGAAGGNWLNQQVARSSTIAVASTPSQLERKATPRTILYYRDPSGAPYWSAAPKRDRLGRDFLPVYDDEESSLDASKPPAAQAAGKILYYRNPMGLPDTSPVPKKDGMGMDYVPVYEDEQPNDGSIVKISLDRVQRSGVRTERVGSRVLVQPVRAVGTVAIDESKLSIVTLRSDGYIEDLFVNTTGQAVRAGEPLFRVYSSQIQQAQIDLLVAIDSARRGIPGTEADRSLSGAMQRLRNLAVPESRIDEVRRSGSNPRTIDWPSPATGVVISKRVINGQRVAAGDELYRIADLSVVWVIADVAERDLAGVSLF